MRTFLTGFCAPEGPLAKNLRDFASKTPPPPFGIKQIIFTFTPCYPYTLDSQGYLDSFGLGFIRFSFCFRLFFV
jgi:hypothetical protein